MIEPAAEVLHEYQGHTRFRSKSAESEANPFRFDEFCGRCRVRVRHPWPPLLLSPHIHYREDESFYALAGTFSVLIGDRSMEAGMGAFVHIAKGTRHTFQP